MTTIEGAGSAVTGRPFREYTHLFIGGRWTESDGPIEPVVNPATEQPAGFAPVGTRADARDAIRAARTAFDDGPWPRMSVAERSAVLRRMADALDRRHDDLVELNMLETGCTRTGAASFQTSIPISHFRDLAERVLMQFPMEQPLPPTVGTGIGQGVVLREPAGVAAIVSAYNFPLYLNLAKLGPALAAGCTTVLKPAPTTPLQALVLAEVALEAGLPDGVLNIVTGGVDVGAELSMNTDVDVVSFTGSDTVGAAVLGQAAPTIKKVILELGGKSAGIVCADADLTKVCASVVRDTILHAGQGCAYLTRTLVHRSRHDELRDMVVAALDEVIVGDPSHPATTMGPLQSAAQRDHVERLIAVGVAEGAHVAHGGGRPSGVDRGFFVEPTLLVDVEPGMTIAQREFFGPVMTMIPFDSDDDAVDIANDSEYGLAGGVWSRDPVRAYRIAQRLRTGYVVVNGGGGGMSADGPFGGYKRSGLGRERGAAGLDEFLETKTVTWGVAGG